MGGSHSLHIKPLNTKSCPPLCSEQGHLTRFLSYGLRLSVTAIEADRSLVAMASKFDRQLVWALEKENQKKVGTLLDSGGVATSLRRFSSLSKTV